MEILDLTGLISTVTAIVLVIVSVGYTVIKKIQELRHNSKMIRDPIYMSNWMYNLVIGMIGSIQILKYGTEIEEFIKIIVCIIHNDLKDGNLNQIRKIKAVLEPQPVHKRVIR